MKVQTKLQSLERAKKQGLEEPIQCIYCKSGYFIYMFPKNGGYFLACSWCHTRLDSENYKILELIREALNK